MKKYTNDTPGNRATFVSVAALSLEDVAFGDRAYFDMEQMDARAEKPLAAKYFQKEAAYLERFADITKQGRQFVNTLYSFRSCGRAIPQVASTDQANRDLIYRRTYDVLRPEITRMTHLMAFRDKLIGVFTDALTAIIPDIKDRDVFPSESFLLAFAQILDLVICIDTMKNMKGSMNNDLSMYKRAMVLFPKDQTEAELSVLPRLAIFLATQDQFSLDIRKALSTMNSAYEDILQDMVNQCADSIESAQYLLPSTKHSNLRAMAYGILLLDGEGEERDITKRKKLKLEKIGKLFKITPIVPLFGDIAITLVSIFQKAPHVSALKWETGSPEDLRNTYSLASNVEFLSGRFLEYVGRAKTSIAAAKLKSKVPEDETRVLYRTALEGVTLLATLTTRVLEQAAWKFIVPVASTGLPETASSYELAVRYNYSSEDKRVLVEFIVMIKNLAGLLYEIDGSLQNGLDRFMYNDIQNFIKSNIAEYYTSAAKKKKPVASSLKFIRDVMSNGKIDDETVKGKSAAPIPERDSPFSLSQLYFARSMADISFNEKSKGMKGGLMKEKNFKDAQVTELQSFFDRTFFYPHILNWRQTIRECSDLSNLWFKEFYLELSKRTQFPISHSLPWILTEFVLESNRADTLQYVFYPLDLYNDAASRTLYDLNSQVIYDEIEAEVNLCFDQFLFRLGQRVFSHYKKNAAMQLLPPDLQVEVLAGGNVLFNFDGMNIEAFEPIMRQREFKLLGRTVDCSNILAQMMNQFLRTCIDIAISRFEASDLTSLIELEDLLDSARLTHKLISKILQLDPFDSLLQEVDHSLSLTSTDGRIVSHTVRELVADFIPNFCYNSVTNRFIRSPVFYAEPIERYHLPKARPMYLYGSKGLTVVYVIKNSMYKGFFGDPHLKSLLNILGEAYVPVVIKEVNNHAELIIRHTMIPYTKAVLNTHASRLPYPSYDIGIHGAYDSILAQFNTLINYANLKSEVIQSFREIGNAIVIVKMFEELLTMERTMSKLHLEDIVAANPAKITLLSHIKNFDQILPTSNTLNFQTWESRVTAITRSRFEPRPVFASLLTQLANELQTLQNDEEGSTLIGTFHRMWCAVQLACAVPLVSGDRSIRELFGDGFLWAGCTLLHLLDQKGKFESAAFGPVLLDIYYSEKSKLVKGTLDLRPDVSQYITTEWLMESLNADIFQYLKSF